jgi:hypothetical protein
MVQIKNCFPFGEKRLHGRRLPNFCVFAGNRSQPQDESNCATGRLLDCDGFPSDEGSEAGYHSLNFGALGSIGTLQ